MRRRQFCLGLSLAAIVLPSCASVAETSAEPEPAPGGPAQPDLSIAANDTFLSTRRPEITSTTNLDELRHPDPLDLRDQLYALFLCTQAQQLGGTTPELSDAFSAFIGGFDANTQGAFVADANGRFDTEMGRAVIDQINANYRLSLRYEDGPFVLLLRRHPADTPSSSDTAGVIALAGVSAENIASLLHEGANRSINKGNFPTSLDCALTSLLHDINNIFGAQTQTSQTPPQCRP